MFSGARYGSRTPSKREMAVVRLVATGLKNKDVALKLGTTENVVKNYLRAIYDKLGFSNRVEVALWHVARMAEHSVKPGYAQGTSVREAEEA